jgi:hypothetical protein
MNLPEIDNDTRAYLLDGKRLRRFTERLRQQDRIRIRLADLWSAFASVYNDPPEGPQRRLSLLVVLQELNTQGKIRLPVSHGKQWDRNSTVALPSVIDLSGFGDQVAPPTWKQTPWHPLLQWILTRRQLSDSDVAFLLRVNQGLVEGWFQEQEPFKYRSLQLTGDEKRLAKLAASPALFGPGRLSLEMLGCEREVLPLAVARCSPAPTMLLFENAAPFMVARRMLPQVSSTSIGCLGYGAGKQLLKSIAYFTTIDPAVREIYYVGDLDGEGLQLAATVSHLSKEVPVRPATRFHLAMFEAAVALGSADGWPVKEQHVRQVTELGLAYLDVTVRDHAQSLVEQGRRIPEEVISHALMRQLLASY